MSNEQCGNSVVSVAGDNRPMTGNYDQTRQRCSSVFLTEDKSEQQVIAELEALQTESFVLVIQCDTKNPPLVYRRCKARPTQSQKDLVSALSGGQIGVRSFSGESFPDGACSKSYYLGWNVFGFQFYMPACYCQVCGYAMDTIRDAIKVVVDTSKVSYDAIRDIRVMCQKVEVECEIRRLR